MPYSESIGFIANLNKPDDIDMVYYIVCHEIAHQWWAHQVIGARMQGATLLSETLAQYTALMIMKKEFGEEMMHKFLRYEMNNYLRSRGLERMKERPLLNVDLNQGYIHYQKGSLAIYYLTEMIGEKRVNAALKELIDAYAYKGPPYPSSHELVDRLRKHTPPDLQYLIKDLFEEITIFDNRTLDAKVTSQVKGSIKCPLKSNATNGKQMRRDSKQKSIWMTGSKSAHSRNLSQAIAMANSFTANGFASAKESTESSSKRRKFRIKRGSIRKIYSLIGLRMTT